MYISFFCCKQKTAYELRISDWISAVCSSDLHGDMVGDVARVRRPRADVDHGDAAKAGFHQMIGGHLRQPFGHAAFRAMLAGDDVARLHEALIVTGSHAVFRHADEGVDVELVVGDRKSTRLNSSH